MKKRFSILTVVIIAFLMLATGVVASSYYHWAGSQNFDDSMNTMDKIQAGIELLMGDLKTERDDHADTKADLKDTKTELENTQTELDNLREQLGLEDGDDSEEALENLIAERNTLQNNINLIATNTSQYVASINSVNGAGPRYDKLVEALPDSTLDYLYDLSTIEEANRNYLNPELGKGPNDKALEQAIKDMEKIKGKSEDTFGVFDEETQNRIEKAHEYEEYVPEEEETTDTGEEDN